MWPRCCSRKGVSRPEMIQTMFLGSEASFSRASSVATVGTAALGTLTIGVSVPYGLCQSRFTRNKTTTHIVVEQQ